MVREDSQFIHANRVRVFKEAIGLLDSYGAEYPERLEEMIVFMSNILVLNRDLDVAEMQCQLFYTQPKNVDDSMYVYAHWIPEDSFDGRRSGVYIYVEANCGYAGLPVDDVLDLVRRHT